MDQVLRPTNLTMWGLKLNERSEIRILNPEDGSLWQTLALFLKQIILNPYKTHRVHRKCLRRLIDNSRSSRISPDFSNEATMVATVQRNTSLNCYCLFQDLSSSHLMLATNSHHRTSYLPALQKTFRNHQRSDQTPKQCSLRCAWFGEYRVLGNQLESYASFDVKGTGNASQRQSHVQNHVITPFLLPQK